MSVRAYKLIEIKTADEPTFNCWNDDRIMEIVSQDGGEDIMIIQKDRAEQELSTVLAELKGLSGDADIEQADELRYLEEVLRQIIKDCGDEDYCEYYCF